MWKLPTSTCFIRPLIFIATPACGCVILVCIRLSFRSCPDLLSTTFLFFNLAPMISGCGASSDLTCRLSPSCWLFIRPWSHCTSRRRRTSSLYQCLYNIYAHRMASHMWCHSMAICRSPRFCSSNHSIETATTGPPICGCRVQTR
jgi:hypothetical protein